jgi:hypothetical protein
MMLQIAAAASPYSISNITIFTFKRKISYNYVMEFAGGDFYV